MRCRAPGQGKPNMSDTISYLKKRTMRRRAPVGSKPNISDISSY